MIGGLYTRRNVATKRKHPRQIGRKRTPAPNDMGEPANMKELGRIYAHRMTLLGEIPQMNFLTSHPLTINDYITCIVPFLTVSQSHINRSGVLMILLNHKYHCRRLKRSHKGSRILCRRGCVKGITNTDTDATEAVAVITDRKYSVLL